jgi:hypothetical protein
VPEAKPYDIPKQLVWEAYLRRDNQGGDSVNQDENGPGLV